MPTAKAAERHLLITLRSQPEHRPRVQELLLELVDLVRAEPGCLYYHLFQQADDPDAFWLGAAWVSDEAVAAHPTPPSPSGRTDSTAAGQSHAGNPDPAGEREPA